MFVLTKAWTNGPGPSWPIFRAKCDSWVVSRCTAIIEINFISNEKNWEICFLHKKSPHSASTLINTVSMKFSALFLREMASYKISKFFVNPSFRYLPSIHLISYQIVNTCFQCLRWNLKLPQMLLRFGAVFRSESEHSGCQCSVGWG